MSIKHGLLVVMLVTLAVWPTASTAEGALAHATAVCSDYSNQKAAQAAADHGRLRRRGSTAFSTRGSDASAV